MTSRLFVIPTNQELVAKSLSILETYGISEGIVRMHSPGFTEIEAFGWNLITPDNRLSILGALLEANVRYLIRMRS